MSACKLIPYYSSHTTSAGLLAIFSPDKFTLNHNNKKTYQSLSDFQTGIGVAAHATLDTEHRISHTRIAFGDITVFLQGSDGGDITVSEVHELLTRIHDILDNAMSKQVGNICHILGYHFNSASLHCHDVWASQVPFLYNFK